MENAKFGTLPPTNWDGIPPEIRELLETRVEPKFELLFQQQRAILEKLESHNAKMRSKREG